MNTRTEVIRQAAAAREAADGLVAEGGTQASSRDIRDARSAPRGDAYAEARPARTSEDPMRPTDRYRLSMPAAVDF